MSLFSDKTSTKPGKTDYWPGHVIAESLVDDTADTKSNVVESRPRKDSIARRKSNDATDTLKGKAYGTGNSFFGGISTILSFQMRSKSTWRTRSAQ